MVRRGCLTAALLVGACGAPDKTSFHDRLHSLANAGMVRVGDRTNGKLDPARVYATRECAVLTNPNVQMLKADLDVRMGLCIKPDEVEIDVASAE